MSTSIIRLREWSRPSQPVQREVLAAAPELDEGLPPVLFVPGFGAGAWVYAEHWLEHAARRGFPAHAMSLRGHGASGSTPKTGFADYVHDVTQVAASLPRQAVLVGHGAGALVVAHALARYPARAAVLLAPVSGGTGAAFSALFGNPFGVLPAVFGGGLRPGRGRLFSREVPSAAAREYYSRWGRASGRAQWRLVRPGTPESAVGDPPVLVVGSPDDKIVPAAALNRVARGYGAAPLLFPGMGHAMMLDARWQEPLDAILDWLVKGGQRLA
jgi:pimeloyl-ACP methyl ester carboxylesterase